MMLLPKTSYVFLVISTQPPQALFKSLESLIPNFIWQNKAPGYLFFKQANRLKFFLFFLNGPKLAH